MIGFPDGFKKISLTALMPDDREALLWVLAEGVPARGLCPRNDGVMEIIRDILPGKYVPVPWASNGFYLELDSQAGSHPLHSAGAFYLQEPSAMAAVSALSVDPGQRVLDLCAAPGGKSIQIAAALAGEGILVANEVVPSRARILSQNIERMGVQNAVVVSEAPEKLAKAWSGWFDRVLVDAPCSGEGMFRREPGSRLQWNENSPSGCAVRQRHILEAASALLREGGLLVYSTCTFNEIENEGVMAGFLSDHPEFSREAFTLPGVGVSENGCLRLWPHRVYGEGHFIGRLRKGAPDEKPEREWNESSASLASVFSEAENLKITGTLKRVADHLWVFPQECPPLTGIRALRTGLSVGEWRGKAFIPDHALAMASRPADFPRVFPLSDKEVPLYLRGEVLDGRRGTRGWTLMAYRNMSLGWSKCVDGMLKNHLPKGLRHGMNAQEGER